MWARVLDLRQGHSGSKYLNKQALGQLKAQYLGTWTFRVLLAESALVPLCFCFGGPFMYAKQVTLIFVKVGFQAQAVVCTEDLSNIVSSGPGSYCSFASSSSAAGGEDLS